MMEQVCAWQGYVGGECVHIWVRGKRHDGQAVWVLSNCSGGSKPLSEDCLGPRRAPRWLGQDLGPNWWP